MNESTKFQIYRKRVMILSSSKQTYLGDDIIGKYGTVERLSSNEFGVRVDGKFNHSSATGVYWFKFNELKVLKNEDVENESEDVNMENFKYVAIVNLLEDCNKKDYAFALYDEDADFMFDLGKHKINETLVVVNAKGNNNRVLGAVKNVLPVKEYYEDDNNRGRRITAEVVGVVNMNGYIDREEEKIRLEELAKKKAAIEKELEKEINKRKSIEYYEEMAKKYSDNSKLAELVSQLKELGE